MSNNNKEEKFKITCSACHKEQWNRQFYKNKGVISKLVSHYVPCKSCIVDAGTKLNNFEEQKSYIKSICQTMNRYYSDDLFDEAYKGDKNVISEYLRKVSVMPHRDKEFINSDFLYDNTDVDAVDAEFENERKKIGITDKVLADWIIYKGLVPKDIAWCEKQYQKLKEEYMFDDDDNVAQTYRNLSISYLKFANAFGDPAEQNKIQTTIEKMEKSLGIQLLQNKDELKDETLGTLIRLCEKSDVFWPEKRFEDHDGFEKKMREIIVWNDVTMGKADKGTVIEKYFKDQDVK